jgi:uncharacterized membrane protein YhaH (DUF805 family)
MPLLDTIGLISNIAIALPILAILLFRLATQKTYAFLLVYLLMIFGYNFFQLGYFDVSQTFINNAAAANNFLDAPLMLLFTLSLYPSKLFKGIVTVAVVILVLTSILIISILGFNTTTATYVLGPGVLIVFMISVYLTWNNLRISVRRKSATGRSIISSGLLFMYGSYLILYTIVYVLKDDHIDEALLLFYLCTAIGCIAITVGTYFESKRYFKLKELLVTRKELSQIYGGQKTNKATLLEAALFPGEHLF